MNNKIATATSSASPKPRYSMRELLAEAKAADVYPLPSEEREWVDESPRVSKNLFTIF